MKNNILELIENIVYLDYCSEYSEPGYTKGYFGETEKENNFILFGDWNKLDKYPNIMEYLEGNYCLEWCDEWFIDYENDKCYRTMGDCWEWQMQIRFCDGYILTPDSPIDDWIEYAKWDRNNHPSDTPKTLPNFIDPVELGYTKFNGDYLNGFCPGQNDKPNEIAKTILETIPHSDHVVFTFHAQQFTTIFYAYYKLKKHLK